MATPQQIETKLRAPRCLNNIPFSARVQCPGTGTKSGRDLSCFSHYVASRVYSTLYRGVQRYTVYGLHILNDLMPFQKGDQNVHMIIYSYEFQIRQGAKFSSF